MKSRPALISPFSGKNSLFSLLISQLSQPLGSRGHDYHVMKNLGEGWVIGISHHDCKKILKED